MSKKNKRSLKKIIGIILIVVGLAVLLFVPATWLYGYMVQRELPAEFERETSDALALNQEVLTDLEGAAEMEKLRQLAIAYIEQLEYQQTIAQLEIPKIGLNMIVVEGTDESALRKGAGHIEGTSLPGMGGNFAVAGDRVLWGGPFLNLDELGEGDEIFVRTPYGKFSYIVTTNFIIDPEDSSVLQPGGEEIITLVTCDPPWGTSHRLIIQARLTSASLLESLSS